MKFLMKNTTLTGLQKAVLSAFLFFAPPAVSATENCGSRNPLTPNARDLLVLKSAAEYNNPDFKGTNLNAVLTTGEREVACPFSPPRAHVKCYSSIQIFGRAAEGDQLRIPSGTEINVSRINSSAEEIFLYPRKVDGLRRTRSGTFRLTCARYVVTSLPGKTPRESDHKRFPCFNEDLSLLFENMTLKSCEGIKSSSPVRSRSSQSTRNKRQRETGSNGSSIE